MSEVVQININVNYLVLKWARESLDISLTDAAKETGITFNRLKQLESGEQLPVLDEMKELSKTYKRTIATLLLEIPPKEKPLPVDRRTLDSKELGKFHEKTIIAVRKARALVESFVELKKDVGLAIGRFTKKASLNDSPQQIANSISKELQLAEIRLLKNDNEVLDAYIEKIELLNIAVFQLSLTQDNLRGFSIVDEVIPVIVIKRGGESATAKLFTLFHELGHILLNEAGLCDTSEYNAQNIEKWCNAFAAEILIPSAELLQMEKVKEKMRHSDENWANKELIELAKFFHVGPLAIVRRLLDHQLTTVAFYDGRHKVWNKPAFGRAKLPEGRNIPKETIKEKGRTYLSLAFKAFDQNRIDIKDLSDLIGIKLSYIPKTRQLLNI